MIILTSSIHPKVKIKRNHAGFTLLEILAVIIVLSFITIGGSTFFITLVNAQLMVDRQSSLLVDSELAFMRMAKQLRSALPFSLMLTNKQHCLKFTPVIGYGFYSSFAKNINNQSIPVSLDPSFVNAIKKYESPTYLYTRQKYKANSSFYSQKLTSVSSSYLTVSAALTEQTIVDTELANNSPYDHKFYLLAMPSAFCLFDDELRYYKNLAISADNIVANKSYTVISKFVQIPMTATLSVNQPLKDKASIFSINDETKQCAHCVTVNVTFTKSNSRNKNLNNTTINTKNLNLVSDNSLDYLLNKSQIVWLRYGL
jgi:MSHA biogenesis protein MshO